MSLSSTYQPQEFFMTDKSPKIPTGSNDQRPDPDALQLQDAPLKQQGDKLEASASNRRTDKSSSAQPTKRE